MPSVGVPHGTISGGSLVNIIIVECQSPYWGGGFERLVSKAAVAVDRNVLV